MADSNVNLVGPSGEALTVPGIAAFSIQQPEAAANDLAKAQALQGMAQGMSEAARAVAALGGTLDEPYPDHEVWLRAVVSYKPSAFAEANPVLAMAYADAVVAGYKTRFSGAV